MTLPMIVKQYHLKSKYFSVYEFFIMVYKSNINNPYLWKEKQPFFGLITDLTVNYIDKVRENHYKTNNDMVKLVSSELH